MAEIVGIREFRKGLAEYIGTGSPIAVTRHDQIVGWFIPTPMDHDAEITSLRRAAETLDALLAERGVDVDEVAAEFKAVRRAEN